jgi:hypothetical protein
MSDCVIGSSAREPGGSNSLVGNLKFMERRFLKQEFCSLKSQLSERGDFFTLDFERKVTFCFIVRHCLLRSSRNIKKNV